MNPGRPLSQYTVPKQCGILSITDTEFSLEKIRLRKIRPSIFREIVLADEPEEGKHRAAKASHGRLRNLYTDPNNTAVLGGGTYREERQCRVARMISGRPVN